MRAQRLASYVRSVVPATVTHAVVQCVSVQGDMVLAVLRAMSHRRPCVSVGVLRRSGVSLFLEWRNAVFLRKHYRHATVRCIPDSRWV